MSWSLLSVWWKQSPCCLVSAFLPPISLSLPLFFTWILNPVLSSQFPIYIFTPTHTHTIFLSLVPPLPLSGSYGLLSSTKCSEMPLELLHFLNSQAASYVPSPSGAIFSHLDAPSQMRQSLLQLSHKPDYASPLKVRRLRRSYLLHTGRWWRWSKNKQTKKITNLEGYKKLKVTPVRLSHLHMSSCLFFLLHFSHSFETPKK